MKTLSSAPYMQMKMTRSPIWNSTAAGQQKAIDFLAGKRQVILRGPNVDLTLSIKGRKFMNSTGVYNMPDGEIYTGLWKIQSMAG